MIDRDVFGGTSTTPGNGVVLKMLAIRLSSCASLCFVRVDQHHRLLTHNQRAMPLLIKNGTLFTATDTFQADILTDAEKIADRSVNSGQDDTRVLDATGQVRLPGGIDPHTHLTALARHHHLR
jgi:hypothetical protein